MRKLRYLSIIILCLLFVPVIRGEAKQSSFSIKYVDVGQGDCAIIECDGHYMMIDGGDSKQSSLIYTVLKNDNIKNIDVMIATHPDDDHIGGLSGALNYAKVSKCYCSTTKHDTKTFNSLVKYLNKQGVSITVPKVGESFSLGSATVTIFGPIGSFGDTNNSSIVTMIQYGSNKFLFMGDAEAEEEQAIIKKNKDIKCDVLKIGHHGSESSTTGALLKATKPAYAVISVGKDNAYGHPVQSTLDSLANSGVEIYRTDLQGDLVITSDGKSIKVATEKKVDASAIKKENKIDIPVGVTYVLNKNTKRFHEKNCKSVNAIKESNRGFTNKSAEEIVADGYKPCGNCKPYVGTTNKQQTSDVKKESETIDATPVTQPAGTTYVLNTNTKKFHYPTCSSVGDMSAKNRKDVSMSRDEIIASGYAPCKRCNP